MTFLIDNTVRVSLIVLIGLCAKLMVRRRSAAVRHWVLAVAVVCAAAVPIVGLLMPTWHLDALPSAADVSNAGQLVTTSTAFSADGMPGEGTPRQHRANAAPARITSNAESMLLGIWAAGAVGGLLVLLVGLARLTWLASRSKRVGSGPWASIAADVAAAFELRRPVAILQSEHPTLLVTWGLIRPKVILPASAPGWSDARARIVLRHELAHIRRGDWLIFMAAELLRVVYWFNPLVWIACRLVRQESENACDDAVLNGGVAGPDYAMHLIDLARALNVNRGASRPTLPAPAMARPSSLQGRISAMLNDRLNRTPLTQPIRVASMAVLMTLTVLLAGVGAQRFFTLSGSVLDSTNRNLTDARLVLTNASSSAKYEVRTDRTGHYEFVGLPPGDYTLATSLPGFNTLNDTIAIVGKDLDRTIQLHVGSLEETLTVTSSVSTPPTSDAADVQRREAARLESRKRAEERQRTALEKCVVSQADTSGGRILAPIRLTNVNPQYPENLRVAGVAGVVKMDALIGTDGNIQEIRAISSPHPDLEAAAMDAVRQWQFTPTLLNCVPIEVQLNVTTRFNSQQ